MGMSIDSSQLETVVKYAAFIDILSEPEKLKDLVKDIKKSTQEYKDLLGVVTSKQEVDSYFNREQAKLEEERKTLKEQSDKLLATVERDKKSCKDKEEELQRTLDSFNKKMLNLDERETQIKKTEGDIQTQLMSATRNNMVSEQRVKDLEVREKELKDKQEQLKKIMG